MIIWSDIGRIKLAKTTASNIRLFVEVSPKLNTDIENSICCACWPLFSEPIISFRTFSREHPLVECQTNNSPTSLVHYIFPKLGMHKRYLNCCENWMWWLGLAFRNGNNFRQRCKATNRLLWKFSERQNPPAPACQGHQGCGFALVPFLSISSHCFSSYQATLLCL